MKSLRWLGGKRLEDPRVINPDVTGVYNFYNSHKTRNLISYRSSRIVKKPWLYINSRISPASAYAALRWHRYQSLASIFYKQYPTSIACGAHRLPLLGLIASTEGLGRVQRQFFWLRPVPAKHLHQGALSGCPPHSARAVLYSMHQ